VLDWCNKFPDDDPRTIETCTSSDRFYMKKIYIYLTYSAFVGITWWIVFENIKIVWGIWEVVLVCAAVCYSGPKEWAFTELPALPVYTLCTRAQLWQLFHVRAVKSSDVCSSETWEVEQRVRLNNGVWLCCMVSSCLYRLVFILWGRLLLQLPLFRHTMCCMVTSDVLKHCVLWTGNYVAIHLALYEQAMCH